MRPSALLLDKVAPAALKVALAVNDEIAGRIEQAERLRNDPRTAPPERKRMIALLIEDVTLLNAERIAIHVRLRGGKTDSLSISRPVPMALVRKSKAEVVVATLDQLLETHTDQPAAEALDAMGYSNWKGEPFTSKRIITARCAYKLK